MLHDANAQFQGRKKWDMPRRGNAEARQINPGDVGIWATCAMKKEAPTVADLRDLFQGVRRFWMHDRHAAFLLDMQS